MVMALMRPSTRSSLGGALRHDFVVQHAALDHPAVLTHGQAPAVADDLPHVFHQGLAQVRVRGPGAEDLGGLLKQLDCILGHIVMESSTRSLAASCAPPFLSPIVLTMFRHSRRFNLFSVAGGDSPTYMCLQRVGIRFLKLCVARVAVTVLVPAYGAVCVEVPVVIDGDGHFLVDVPLYCLVLDQGDAVVPRLRLSAAPNGVLI